MEYIFYGLLEGRWLRGKLFDEEDGVALRVSIIFNEDIQQVHFWLLISLVCTSQYIL